MSKKDEKRLASFLPDGKPKMVRCYDNGGKTADRYTVVFTGRYTHKTGGDFIFLSMSTHPTHPQGVGQHGSDRNQIDRPAYSHLGKRIKFDDLPEDCRKVVLRDYIELWDLKIPMKSAT